MFKCSVYLLFFLSFQTFSSPTIENTIINESDLAINISSSIHSNNDTSYFVPGISFSKFFPSDNLELQAGLEEKYYLKGNYYQRLSDSDFSLIYSLGMESNSGSIKPNIGFGFGKSINENYSLSLISSVNFDNEVTVGLQLKRNLNFKSTKSKPLNDLDNKTLSPPLSNKEDVCTTTYVVQKGEYIWMIGRKYHINGNELLKLNPNFKNPNLVYEGDVLCIEN